MEASVTKFLAAISSGVVTRVVNIICSIMMVPLVIGHLGSQQYGMLIAINSLAHWVLFDTGVTEGLKQKLMMQNNKHLHGSLVSATIYATLAFALVLSSVSLLIVNSINFEDTFDQPALVAALVTCSALIPLKITRDIFTAYQDGAVHNIMHATGSVLSLCLFFLAIKFELPLWAFSACYTLPFIVTGLISLWIVIPKKYAWLSHAYGTPDFNFLIQDRALLIGFGAFGVSRMLLNSVDVVLVNGIIDGDAAATYGLVVRYFLYLEVAFGLVSYPMWSFLTAARSSGDIGTYSLRWRQLKLVGLLFATFLASVLFVVSRPALELWSSGQINPSNELLVLACGYSSLRVINDITVTKLRVFAESTSLGKTAFVNLVLHLSMGSVILQQTGSIELFLLSAILLFLVTRVVPNIILAYEKI